MRDFACSKCDFAQAPVSISEAMCPGVIEKLLPFNDSSVKDAMLFSRLFLNLRLMFSVFMLMDMDDSCINVSKPLQAI